MWDVRAHGLRPATWILTGRAPIAQPPERHLGAPVTGHQRAQHQDRGAHGLDQLIGREAFADRSGVDLLAHVLIDGDRHPHARQQLDHRCDVVQMRHVADRDRPVG
jgi:hypothetical protein